MTRTSRPPRPPRWARLAAVGLTVALTAGGCSLRTAGSPKGDLGLTATFDDVHNLVVGHSVKLADVTIGTVTHVRLDGYRAEVTMSIEDGHPLPVGTTAVLAKTSLLGEQYIELRPPDGSLPTTAGLLHDGDEITRTTTEAEFEEVTERAIEFLGAVTASDLNTIVSTGAQAVGGRGRELNGLLRDLSAVVTDLSSQREQIAQTIDGFARLSRDLAANDEQVAGLVDDLAGASVTLAANRDRMLTALAGIRDMSEVSTDTVLLPHLDDLISTLRDLDPIVATVAGQRPLIESLLQSVNQFLVKISNNVAARDTGAAAQAQYIWARGLATPSGTVGDAEPPVPTDPAPVAPPVAAPADPRNGLDDVNNLVASILGLLGALPGVTLPDEVCDQLVGLQQTVDDTLALGLAAQLPQVCPADGGSTSPGGTAPGGQGPLPVPVPGTGGSGGSGGGELPLPLPGVGG
ncbi:MAG: MCE family protein [Acidimicrobiales bacterium]|nr:MCE family protein [Acidimicrobiales bacterium]